MVLKDFNVVLVAFVAVDGDSDGSNNGNDEDGDPLATLLLLIAFPVTLISVIAAQVF
jgi:hypothetical protein